jgi:hypothetical protein
VKGVDEPLDAVELVFPLLDVSNNEGKKQRKGNLLLQHSNQLPSGIPFTSIVSSGNPANKNIQNSNSAKAINTPVPEPVLKGLVLLTYIPVKFSARYLHTV